MLVLTLFVLLRLSQSFQKKTMEALFVDNGELANVDSSHGDYMTMFAYVSFVMSGDCRCDLQYQVLHKLART